MKRITINFPDDLADGLKERAATTGVRQAEQIRRAVASYIVGNRMFTGDAVLKDGRKSVHYEHQLSPQEKGHIQPVLFTPNPNKETR